MKNAVLALFNSFLKTDNKRDKDPFESYVLDLSHYDIDLVIHRLKQVRIPKKSSDEGGRAKEMGK